MKWTRLLVAVFLLMSISGVAKAHELESARTYPCRFAVGYKFRQPNGSYSKFYTKKGAHRRIHYKLVKGVKHINAHKVLKTKPFLHPDQIEQLILCLFPKYGLDGPFAAGVARCESEFNPNANTNPPYYGVFQHWIENSWEVPYGDPWGARACAYWHCGASVFNGYANVHVTAGMVRSGGWGPWSCA